MMAWHARALGGADTRVWFGGRFLVDWADPEAVAALAGAFAHYDAEEVWRALGVTADLFARLARETASALGYAYPARAEAQARAFVVQLQTRLRDELASRGSNPGGYHGNDSRVPAGGRSFRVDRPL